MEKQIKLLIIDDDKVILGLINDFFTLIGYTGLKAKDGEEGLEIFHSENPNIVLVDLRMPKVDGFQVLKEIRKESPDTDNTHSFASLKGKKRGYTAAC
jgi:DNA-binding response OmpR family regulator